MIITKDSLPTKCEFCNSDLVWDGVNLVCSNVDCSNSDDEKLKAWVINIAPVEGLGWKTFRKLLFPTITTVQELYKQRKNLYYIIDKETSEKGLFNKVLDKLIQPVSVSQFILALNIPGVGKISAKNLENYSDIKNLLEAIVNGSSNYVNCYKNLNNILQDVTATKNFLEYENLKFYYNLVKINYNNKNEQKENKIENKGTVVITGSLSIKREDFIKKLEEKGWKIANKITKSTNYLITNTPNSGTSKNKKADKLGVTKITETDFIEKVMQ